MAVKTFLLAAGLGTRLRPYTLHRPKPCIPFLGIPMMSYGLFLSHASDYKDIVINTHQFPDKVRFVAESTSRSRLTLNFSHEATKPLGSGGALFAAKSLLLNTDKHFFVINGDNVFVPEDNNVFSRLFHKHTAAGALATLLVSDSPQLIQKFNPLWIDQNNNVRAIGKNVTIAPSWKPVHYMGFKIFHRDILDHVPSGASNIFTDVLMPLINKGEKIHVMHEKALWWETGDFSSLFSASCEAMHLIHDHKDHRFFSQVYEWLNKDFHFSHLTRGQDIIFNHSSSTVNLQNITGSAFIDANVYVHQNMKLENVLIGRSCSIEKNAQNELILGDDE